MTKTIRAELLATAFLLAAAVPTMSRAEDVPAPSDATIVVTGQKPATQASAGTKADTPLLETPQSISVISRDDLDARGVLNLNQALRYTAGITPDQRGGTASRYDQFKLRGFDAPQFLDGLKLIGSPTGYAVPQIDVSRLDRVEVVKGPASVLYGQSSPGGLVALTSKLPVAGGSYGSVEATYGSYDLYRVDADIGGALTADGFVRYRVSGTVNGSDSQLSQTKSRRYSISPAIAIGGDGDTTLTFLGNVQHDPKSGAYGSVPLTGSLKPAAFGRIGRSFYDGDPGFERYDRDQVSLTYLAEHRFGDSGWALRSRGRYLDVKAIYKSVYGFGLFQDPLTFARDPAQEALGNFSRGTGYADETLQNWTFDNQASGRITTGPVTHDLLVGTDYQTSRATEAFGFGSAPPINVLRPVYGLTITPVVTGDYLVNQRQTGVYGQDQISIGGLRLTASGRYDWYHANQSELVSGGRSTQSKKKFTYRVGGLYLFDFGLAPYASYSTSFEPQSGLVSGDGGRTIGQADPSAGKQVEAGFKYTPPGTQILLTAAAFRIEQTNLIIAVPNTGYGVQSGKVRSKGVEFEAKVPLSRGLSLTAAASRQDVKDVTNDTGLIGVAKSNASLFALYTVQDGGLRGAGVGAGVRYVGKSYGGIASYGAITVPDYTLFDATASYDLSRIGAGMEGWKLQVSARNLFDKRHITSCYGSFFEWCWYGERRSVQATLGYRW